MLEADRHNGWFCHAHGLRRICIYIYFSNNSYAFRSRISYIYMARNYNYPTAFFFSFVYKFLKDVNKVVDLLYYYYYYYYY